MLSIEVRRPEAAATADHAELTDDDAAHCAADWPAGVVAGNLGEEARMARFGATVAHELRGPLAPIVNGVHILKTIACEDPQCRQVIGMIERQLWQLTGLLDDLMEVGGFRCANVRTGTERVDLEQVIAASVEACSPAIGLRNQELKVETDGLPLTVLGDPRRLTQVFSNLITNSIKYTPPGGHIVIRLEGKPDTAVVEVRDDGMGVAPQELPHIFELFKQGAEHRYAPRHGLGIGLSVVKNIVHLHGGSVMAHSDGPGRGSTFTVHLPLCATPPDSAS